eukprot:1174121-Prorocentrum_minimum.AAC.2
MRMTRRMTRRSSRRRACSSSAESPSAPGGRSRLRRAAAPPPVASRARPSGCWRSGARRSQSGQSNSPAAAERHSGTVTVSPYRHLIDPYRHLRAEVRVQGGRLLAGAQRLIDPYRPLIDPYRHLIDPYRHLTNPYRHLVDPYCHLIDPYRHLRAEVRVRGGCLLAGAQRLQHQCEGVGAKASGIRTVSGDLRAPTRDNSPSAGRTRNSATSEVHLPPLASASRGASKFGHPAEDGLKGV